jgi:hypothetical protein
MSAQLKQPVGSILYGQSWDEYRAIDALNNSRLKPIDVSPAHYQEKLRNPTETDALRLGIAAHCLVLEPKRYETDFAVWRERKANGDSAARKGPVWDSFVAAHPGCTVITEDQETDALTMQSAIFRCKEAMDYLSFGDPEVTMVCELHGRLLKGRLDWKTNLGNGIALVGVKTAADLRLDGFSRAAARLLYHCQWALYFDLYAAITGVRPVEVVEIVVEKHPPHDVVVYQIGDDTLKVGRNKYLELLQKLEQCERENHWPGVGGGAKQIFSLPSYMYEDEIYA